MTTTTCSAAATRYVITRSATGKRHAMTTEARDTTGRALCGSDASMPSADQAAAPGGTRAVAANALSDLYDHTDLPVCRRCLEALHRPA